MFAQLKEEFIDVTMSMSISPSEFEKIQTMVFNKSLESKLKNMFKQERMEVDYMQEKTLLKQQF